MKKKMFKSSIQNQIKFTRIYFMLVTVYWVVYNFIFGWNKTPVNATEQTLDDITGYLLAMGLGFVVHLILKYIDFKMTWHILQEYRKRDKN